MPATAAPRRRPKAADVLVGQALITANLCGPCGGPLKYSKLTGQPCEPDDPSAHFHEDSEGGVPVCCPCTQKAGIICAQLAGAEEVAEALMAMEEEDGSSTAQ